VKQLCFNRVRQTLKYLAAHMSDMTSAFPVWRRDCQVTTFVYRWNQQP